MDSNVSGIERGDLIWAQLANSQFPVDMKLEAAKITDQWIEVSEHRQKLMTNYNRYRIQGRDVQISAFDAAKLEAMAWEDTFNLLWEAGYVLSRDTFGTTPVHPAGNGPWSETDSDLSSAVVISLSGAGKTARG